MNRNGGQWTEAKYNAFIVGALRAGARRWPPKFETLNEAKTSKKVNGKTGRVAQHYLCADCGKDYPSKEVNVDHIEPVVDPAKGFISWDVYIARMFCEKDNLQVLCSDCHTKKSAEERKQRKTK